MISFFVVIATFSVVLVLGMWFLVECWMTHWLLGLIVTFLVVSFFDERGAP